jgi:hypothetical protein
MLGWSLTTTLCHGLLLPVSLFPVAVLLRPASRGGMLFMYSVSLVGNCARPNIDTATMYFTGALALTCTPDLQSCCH